MLREFLHVLSVPWAIHPQHGQQLAVAAWLVQQRMLPLTAEAFGVTPMPEPDAYQYVDVKNEAGTEVAARVAIHTIEGPLTRGGDLCSYGMQELADLFTAADADEDITAHVLRIHSPGGTVEGTEYFAQAIVRAEKPVIVWTEQAYSAAYWIAAAGDHIMLGGETSGVGSIGVQIGFRDYTALFEKNGVKDVLIRATTSPDKNKHLPLPLSEEDIEQIQSDALDPLDSQFMRWVKTRRPGVPDDALSGKTYFAEDALQLKLADSIGSLSDAIQLALDMAGEPYDVEPQDDDEMNFNLKKKPVQPAAQGQEPAAQAPETPEVAAEQPAAEEASQLTALQATVQQLTATVQQQSQTITALNAAISAVQAENHRLALLPAADPEAEVASPAQDASAALGQRQYEDPAVRAIAQITGDGAHDPEFAAALERHKMVQQAQQSAEAAKNIKPFKLF